MRINCEVCGIEGYLQTLGDYHRVRHYEGINPEAGESKFHYHQESKDWVQKKLSFPKIPLLFLRLVKTVVRLFKAALT